MEGALWAATLVATALGSAALVQTALVLIGAALGSAALVGAAPALVGTAPAGLHWRAGLPGTALKMTMP